MARKDGETTGADEDAYHEKLREENTKQKTAVVKSGPVKKKPKVVKF